MTKGLSSILLVLVTGLMLGITGCSNNEPAKETNAPATQKQTQETEKTAPATEIVLATTTSTQDSGLLDVLVPAFEEQSNPKVKLKVVAVGTGQAIQMGEDGNADVLLVHARASEDKFMQEGFGENAWDVMYNQFMIVGPANDPAGIKGATSGAEALKKIAAAKATFISRGDDSGTHKKELSIWEKAGIKPQGNWYISAGQGMGDTLRMAGEKNGYTITDEASFLTNKPANLQILLQGPSELLNPYGVMQVKTSKYKEAGAQFVKYIVSTDGQKLIGDFGKDKFGKGLFTPNAKQR